MRNSTHRRSIAQSQSALMLIIFQYQNISSFAEMKLVTSGQSRGAGGPYPRDAPRADSGTWVQPRESTVSTVFVGGTQVTAL